MPTYNETDDDIMLRELERKSTKINKMSDEKVIEKEQLSNPGISVTAGEIESSEFAKIEYKDLIKKYLEMIDGCPVISTTLNLIKYPMLQSKIIIESGDKNDSRANEAVDYGYWCFENLYKKERYLRKHKLTALDFGMSMHEFVEKKGEEYKFNLEGKDYKKITNRVVKLAPIQVETVQKFHYNRLTEFVGIQHEKRIPELQTEFIEIPASKLHIFTFNEKFDDIRGNSILKPVRYYFDAGNKILTSKVNATIKASGIVGIKTKGALSPADQSKVEGIARTIASMSKGYYTIDDSKAEVVLHELKAQQDILGIIQFINRMKFYNTMSQFITAGIGESGSRAATGEHKSAYELALNYISADLQDNYQDLLDYFINISYLSDLSKEKRPKIRFSTITQSDMLKESTIFKNLTDAGLILTDVDKNIIRERMNLPVDEIKLNDKQTVVDENKIESKEIEKSNELSLHEKKEIVVEKIETKKELNTTHLKCKCNDEVDNVVEDKSFVRNVSEEILAFEREIMELDRINQSFEESQKKAEDIVNDSTHKYIEDIIRQLKKDYNKDINVRVSLMEEFTDNLVTLYETLYDNGYSDVVKEYNKLSSKPKELALTSKDKRNLKNNLGKLTKKFMFDVKTITESSLSRISTTALEKMGGIESFMLEMELGFKTDKRNLIKETQAGYTEGRGESLLDLSDDVELFLITASLDKGLCEECGKYDSMIATKEEIESEGIQFSSPVIPFCLGKDRCRCQIGAWQLKKS